MNGFINFQANDNSSRGYLALPESGQGPGVLVMHALWGLNTFFQGFCDRLARQGFVAFSPDLYDGKVAATIVQAKSFQESMDFQEARDRAVCAVKVLKERSYSPSGLGAIGFSMGAAWVLFLSCLQPEDFRAVTVFYGSEAGEFSKAQCAFQGHFSDVDEWEPVEGVKKLESDLLAAGKETRFHIYPGVQHWFFEKGRPEYDSTAARKAWRRTLTFLRRHLLMDEKTAIDQKQAGSGEPSDAAVRRATGKSWQEWYTILDEAGAGEMSHPQIARYLEKELGVSGWWAQSVTVSYERARGRRIKHEMPEGFQISKSKTFQTPVSRVYQAWTDEIALARWLGQSTLDVRKATPEKMLRINWHDGKSTVEVSFTPKGESKSSVTVQHNKLSDAAEAEKMKEFWAQALERLKDSL